MARKALWSGGGIRPSKLFLCAFVGGAGALLPAGKCDSEGPAHSVATPVPAARATAPSPIPEPTPDLFASSVRPVLVARCAPCHEPGGKLYAKPPFDDSAVVAAHSAGILRRLKGEDAAAIEKWVATLPRPGTVKP